MTVTIRYFAAARAAAGTTEEQVTARCADDGSACTVGDVLDAVVLRHGPDLARVLQRCSYLLDEVAVHGRETTIAAGQAVDILPPFAGG